MRYTQGWALRAARWLVVLFVASGVLSGIPLAAQQPASADNTVPLFAVMAAVNAAGYDIDLESPRNSPVRKAVRADIEAANPPVLKDLRVYYAEHRNPNGARDLSQWISFALLVGPPPDFAFRVKDAELPAEVAALKDFQPLLVRFYQEANLEKLWEKYRPEYEAELNRYNEGLAEAMLQVNGYLRLASSQFLGRDFSVYVDLLGAPEQANARSFGRDYYVVLSRASRPQLEEVRHGYLHYVLEPMSLKYRALIQSKADLRAFADEAPALDPTLKSNFGLLLSESLIRAVELRMTRLALPAKQARAEELAAEGNILTPYFFDALALYEKQEAGMRIYYPDLIENINVKKEQRRLSKIAFLQAPTEGAPHELELAGGGPAGALAGPSPSGTAAPAAGSDEEKLLAQGEDAMARRDLAGAKQAFQAAADAKGKLQGRALYGLALVASQERQPQLAKTYFQQAIQWAPDAHVAAWANIYIGRILDMEENREEALKHYQQALQVAASEPAARQAAERGLQAPFRWEQRKGTEETSKP